MSSITILSYTVSKLARFLRHSVEVSTLYDDIVVNRVVRKRTKTVRKSAVLSIDPAGCSLMPEIH